MYRLPCRGEEAKLGGLPPERGRENNGRIVAGRDRGVDGCLAEETVEEGRQRLWCYRLFVMVSVLMFLKWL